MWQRLSALAVCGMSALWAGACDGLPTGFPEGSEFPDLFSDIPQTLSFQLSVKHGAPAFRITVRPGWPANHGIWSWGNEIVVGFESGYFHVRRPGEHEHSIDRSEEHTSELQALRHLVC